MTSVIANANISGWPSPMAGTPSTETYNVAPARRRKRRAAKLAKGR
jgi:hypothetical protein